MKAKILASSFTFVIMVLIGPAIMRKAHGQNGPPLNIADLPQDGIVVVGPADPQFDGMMIAMLKGQSNPEIEILKPYSVFIHNKSQRAAVAYTVRWIITRTNDQIIQHEVTLAELGPLIGRRISVDAPGGHAQWNAIGRGSFKFLSLVSVDPRSGAIMGAGTQDPSDASKTLASQSRGPAGRHLGMLGALREEFEHSKSITVEVDGVLFDDGVFVGPNKHLSFDKFRARVNAKHDLRREISILLARGIPPGEVFDHVNKIASGPHVSLSGKSSPSDYYNRFKKIDAQEIMRMRGAVGDSALAMVLEDLRSPWPKLSRK